MVRSDEVVVELASFPVPVQIETGPWEFDRLIAIGVKDEFAVKENADLSDLKHWLNDRNDFVVGHLSYTLRTLLEDVPSNNHDLFKFPLAFFFVPKHLILVADSSINAYSHSPVMVRSKPKISDEASSLAFQGPSISSYLNTVSKLKRHIQQGDIYEVNFCVQHLVSEIEIDPYRLFRELIGNSSAPFSSYFSRQGRYLMGTSPERFMMKKGKRIVSQPMKGTNRRTTDNADQMQRLRNDAKEVSENVMITDLVRNDLSKSATKGSVRVDELCGVYPFTHVNAMISTVSAELREDVHPLDAILNAFPMGSMTGAPKIRAMELIDEFEDFERGLFSGAVGYFTPELDFDFNVVIRSVLYNADEKMASFPTGSAITINSDPEKEWEECVLKAEAMRNVIQNHAK